MPEVYGEPQATSTFEKDLWKRFWDLANDEKLARESGVRAIHGDAPYMRLGVGTDKLCRWGAGAEG